MYEILFIETQLRKMGHSRDPDIIITSMVCPSHVQENGARSFHIPTKKKNAVIDVIHFGCCPCSSVCTTFVTSNKSVIFFIVARAASIQIMPASRHSFANRIDDGMLHTRVMANFILLLNYYLILSSLSRQTGVLNSLRHVSSVFFSRLFGLDSTSHVRACTESQFVQADRMHRQLFSTHRVYHYNVYPWLRDGRHTYLLHVS